MYETVLKQGMHRVSNELASWTVAALNVVATQFVSESEQALSCLEILNCLRALEQTDYTI